MDDTRRALLRWTTSVMEARGWSAAHWSRLAQVTPSNLTRFLSEPARGSLPSAETIGQLARAAGSEPRFIDEVGPAPVVRVPLLDRDQVVALLALGCRAAAAFLVAALRQNCGCVPALRHRSRRGPTGHRTHRRAHARFRLGAAPGDPSLRGGCLT